MTDNNQRTNTSTQIRNLYSEGLSYLNIKFYNANLSFSFQPFLSKNANGNNTYDKNNALQTTVNFEGAYALWKMSNDILEDKIQEAEMVIQCASNTTLMLSRKLAPTGMFETTFSITKNNVTIPFKFKTIQHQVKENGQIVTKTIECGLGAFMKTIDGYLTGINADRHLDKLTDDYIKLQEGNNNNQQQNNFNNNNYRQNGNGGYKKPYNGYKKPYVPNTPNTFQQNNQQNNQWGRQQDMSSYSLKS